MTRLMYDASRSMRLGALDSSAFIAPFVDLTLYDTMSAVMVVTTTIIGYTSGRMFSFPAATEAIMSENSPMAIMPRPAPSAFLAPNPAAKVDSVQEKNFAMTNTMRTITAGMMKGEKSGNRLRSTRTP